MYEGLSLQELATKIADDEKAKQDYIVPGDRMHCEIYGNVPFLNVDYKEEYDISDIAHTQIANTLKIPVVYYKRMLEELPELLAKNVNGWFDDEYKRRHMIRTMRSTCRAFLSDRYKPMDHAVVMECVVPALAELADGPETMTMKSTFITEKRMYLQVVVPTIQAEVRAGDWVQPGLIVSNSEVGLGRFTVESLLYFLACKNGMIGSHSVKKTHLGQRLVGAEEDYSYLKDDTVKASDKALRLQMRDAIAHCFDKDAFMAQIELLKIATGRPIPENRVTTTIENVTRRYSFNENEGESVLGKLIKGADLSQFGLGAAVTNLANDVGESDYDRAVGFERVGGQIIDLTDDAWKVLITPN